MPASTASTAATAVQPLTSTATNLPSPPLTATLLNLTNPPPLPSEWTRSALLRKWAHAFCKVLQSNEFDPDNFVRNFFIPGNDRHHCQQHPIQDDAAAASASVITRTNSNTSTNATAIDDDEEEEEQFVEPTIMEHGPAWACKSLPFLGRKFRGTEGCVAYFEELAKTLKMSLPRDAFPPDESFIVDPEADVEAAGGLKGVVCVVGKGRFENRETGKNWQETFIYKLSGFDEEGRIAHWEIWADPLSAHDAAKSYSRQGDDHKSSSSLSLATMKE